jgi:hypothetical protein
MPGLTQDSVRRLHRQLKRAERGEFNNPPRRGNPHVPRDPHPRVVMLLEDCASGDRAECAVLVEVESTETQIVGFLGQPVSGTFKLSFDGQQTEALAYDVTAEQMQTALGALSSISPGDVIVEMGPGASVGNRGIYRWLVSFTGQYEGSNVSELVATNVDLLVEGAFESADALIEVRSLPDLEDTGETIDCLCVVPLPTAVTLHAGAIAIAVFVPSFGYVFNAVECRDCEIAY